MMNLSGKMKKVAFAVGLGAVVCLLGAYGSMRFYLPKTEGGFRAPFLKEKVTVLRDAYGVPHVFAESADDLFFAFGFVTAQDRFWEMEMLRRMASGTMSEVLGKKMLGQDTEMRTIGLRRLAESEAKTLAPEAKRFLEDYAQGVNRFLETNQKRLPIGFRLLHYKPEPWKVEDSVVVLKFLQASFSSSGHMALLWEKMAHELPENLLKELLGDSDALALRRYYAGEKKEARADQPLSAWRRDDERRVDGSNAWVVDGTLAAHKKPLLANDPHTPLLVPCYWYEIQLSGGGFDTAGVCFPGLPIFYIGRNKDVAWGLTMANVDDTDVYTEQTNPRDPSLYRTPGGWKRFQEIRESIPVKGQAPEELTVRFTENGVVCSSLYNDTSRVLSLRWTGFLPDQGIMAFLNVMRAKRSREILAAVQNFGSPALNLHFGDTSGSIGHAVLGYIPNRSALAGSIPTSGWKAEHRWKGVLPFRENPQVIDPPAHYTASANNQVHHPWAYITRYYAPRHRVDRVKELLEHGKRSFDEESFSQMQNDTLSLQAEETLPHILKNIDASRLTGDVEKKALQELRAWDYRFELESVGATVYHSLYEKLMQETFRRKMPKDVYDAFIEIGYWAQILLDRVLDQEQSPWLDNDREKGHEAFRTFVTDMFRQTVADLSQHLSSDTSRWAWKEGHWTGFKQFMFTRQPLMEFFNVGPLAVSGEHSTLKRGNDFLFYDKKTRAQKQQMMQARGASYRMIVDLSDPNIFWSVLPPGESAYRFSGHYKDQTELWQKGGLKTVSMDRKKLEAEARHRLVLSPGKD